MSITDGLNGKDQVQEKQVEYVVQRKLTYEDYAKIPNETGYTIQLIDGCILREPGPTVLHQRVSARLQLNLTLHFRVFDPDGEVLDAPLDLQLDEHTVVQPDLLFFPSTKQVTETPIKIMPDLVVEILSPSTARTDRIRKFASYEKAGIPHYWLVDPDGQNVQCYSLVDHHYSEVAHFTEGTFSHPEFPGLNFGVTELFSN